MVNAPTLYPEPMEVAPPPGRGVWAYAKRTPGRLCAKDSHEQCRHGWVVVIPVTPSNRNDFEYKGFEIMSKYGEFPMGTRNGAPRATDARGVAWNPADEQWRLILQRGGAVEFPADQVIAFGWHRRPPYREAQFPQVEDLDIIDIECPECPRVMSAVSDGEVTEMLRAHLTTRMNARHSYSIEDLREFGKEMELNFDTARSRSKPVRRGRAKKAAPETIEL